MPEDAARSIPRHPAVLVDEGGKGFVPPPPPERDRSLDWHRNSGRRWLPTLGELIDRLSIVTLKEIHLGAAAYRKESADLQYDIDLVLREHFAFDAPPGLRASELRAVMIIMLANATIWANESKARAGGDDQDKLLKFTHSINGVRNQAKNVVAAAVGERKDLKIDCLAASLIAEFGNWDLFGEGR